MADFISLFFTKKGATIFGIVLIGLIIFGAIGFLPYLFGVLIPIVAILIFVIGIVYRVLNWAKAPVPFRITTTCGQQKSLPWIKSNNLESPYNMWGVIGRMVLEVLLFRSLFRNTKVDLKEGQRIVYGGNKYLWIGAMAFHWSLLIILLRHLKFFTEPVPGFVNLLQSLDGFFEIGVPTLYISSILASASLIYLLLHKPPGYLSTTDDPHGRPTVMDLLSITQRIYPVGRLDMDSEGLLLLTNDGPLTQRLTHPRYQHEREYRVLVLGKPRRQALQALRQGVELEDGKTSSARVHFIESESAPQGTTWLRIILREGRKRQIRRMCAAVGHPAQRLIRVRMGPLHLDDLKPGESRRLTRREIKSLRTIAGLQPGQKRGQSRRKK